MKKKSVKAQERHKVVLQVIEEHAVENQNMLISLLKEQHNIVATQAMISRDLRDLGIVKRKIDSKLIYDLPAINVSKEILQRAIVDIMHNESMIVVKTLAGLADFVGDYLDGCDDIGVMGTISGENTLFIVPETQKRIKSICANVKKALYIKEKDYE